MYKCINVHIGIYIEREREQIIKKEKKKKSSYATLIKKEVKPFVFGSLIFQIYMDGYVVVEQVVIH